VAHDSSDIRELKKIKIESVGGYICSTPKINMFLALNFSVCRTIIVPTELAKKLQENENTKYGLPYSWFVKWATLYYFDADGNEHEIEAEEDSPDTYKRADDMDWQDDDEQED
jgi:hypothetical protein